MDEHQIERLEAEITKLRARVIEERTHSKENGETIALKIVAILGYIRAALKHRDLDSDNLKEILIIAERDCLEVMNKASDMRTMIVDSNTSE